MIWRRRELEKCREAGIFAGKSNERIAMSVSKSSIFINVILSSGKLLAGIFGHSGAMISDAVHSASDVFSTLIVIVGIRLAGRESDENHPYGHERLECVAALLLAILLGITGFCIGFSGIRKVLAKEAVLEIPGVLPLGAAAVSIVVKEAMYWYTRSAARLTGSGALMADAWHHRSDALSSVGSFAGIMGARAGFPAMDALAGAFISFFIMKTACDIFRDAIGKMTDESCDRETSEAIKGVILKQAGVLRLDDMKTRVFGSRIYVDIEIGVDGDATLRNAHATAEQVHDAVEQKFSRVKHCMVHVNPVDDAASSDGEKAKNGAEALDNENTEDGCMSIEIKKEGSSGTP